MRNFILIVLLALIPALLPAAQWKSVTSPVPVDPRVTLVSSGIDRTVVRLTIGGFTTSEVMTPAGPAVVISVGNGTRILSSGSPDLPQVAVPLVIPDQAATEVRIISAEYQDFTGMLVAPSKGVVMRDTDPSSLPYVFGPGYSQNAFYPATEAETGEPYIIRNVRGQTILLHPFRYNPVTRTLRVCHSMTVELARTAESGVNPLPVLSGQRIVPPHFRDLMGRRFVNFDALTYTVPEDYGNLLVICYGPFMEAMEPYIAWKRAIGFPTEMVNKDSAGTTAADIKSFIANYYNTKGLTHVLLVGDAPQIPTNTGSGLGGASDNAYGYIVGNDHFIDAYIGRFSAETAEQVTTQVQRTIDYEQNPSAVTDDWFNTVIGIASNQGPGDDGEYDYQHIRNLQSQCLDYTYTGNPELFDGSQGGNDAPGDPTPPMVAADVNAGSGLILYTGHGSKTAWSSSGFSTYNVGQLTNTGMWPFIWSVACVNGQFMTGSPCFAEAWLRASQGGQPTGAIAFLGSTINQSWDSPMEGQDEMVRILTEGDSTNIKRSFAGLSMSGCMRMIDAYGVDGRNMADTWTLFGDPTVMVRTAQPEELAVQADSILFVSDSTLTVLCDVPFARVTATVADTILATGVVESDIIMLSFPPLSNAPDTIRLVVTAYNRIPWQGEIAVMDIPEPVVAGFTAYPTLVVPGHTVAFADTSVGMTRQRTWYFPGGDPEVSHEQNPVVLYDSVGIFNVKLVVFDGFTSDSVEAAGYITVDWPTSAGIPVDDTRITISPNPGNGIFSLRATTRQNTLDITVMDVTGRTVYSSQARVSSGNLVLPVNLGHQPDGIYFIRVNDGFRTTAAKLIIRK